MNFEGIKNYAKEVEAENVAEKVADKTDCAGELRRDLDHIDRQNTSFCQEMENLEGQNPNLVISFAKQYETLTTKEKTYYEELIDSLAQKEEIPVKKLKKEFTKTTLRLLELKIALRNEPLEDVAPGAGFKIVGGGDISEPVVGASLEAGSEEDGTYFSVAFVATGKNTNHNYAGVGIPNRETLEGVQKEFLLKCSLGPKGYLEMRVDPITKKAKVSVHDGEYSFSAEIDEGQLREIWFGCENIFEIMVKLENGESLKFKSFEGKLSLASLIGLNGKPFREGDKLPEGLLKKFATNTTVSGGYDSAGEIHAGIDYNVSPKLQVGAKWTDGDQGPRYTAGLSLTF